jgi:hypothetical protein
MLTSSFDEESEVFYEEVNERLLAIECGEYDCGQCDKDDLISQLSFEENEICEEILTNQRLNLSVRNVCKKHVSSYEDDTDTDTDMDDTDTDTDTDMDMDDTDKDTDVDE